MKEGITYRRDKKGFICLYAEYANIAIDKAYLMNLANIIAITGITFAKDVFYTLVDRKSYFSQFVYGNKEQCRNFVYGCNINDNTLTHRVVCSVGEENIAYSCLPRDIVDVCNFIKETRAYNADFDMFVTNNINKFKHKELIQSDTCIVRNNGGKR